MKQIQKVTDIDSQLPTYCDKGTNILSQLSTYHATPDLLILLIYIFV